MIHVRVSPDRLFAGQDSELAVRLTNTGAGPCTSVVFKLKLPTEVACLRGDPRLQADRLLPGEHVEARLRVRAKLTGVWTATSTNFSFRDHFGRTCRVSDFRAPLAVEPAPSAAPAASPELRIRLDTNRLPYREWDTVRGRVENSGRTTITRASLSISGPFEVHGKDTVRDFGPLPPGAVAEFSFHVQATGRGSLPVNLRTRCENAEGGSACDDRTVTVRVSDAGDPFASATPQGGRKTDKILYLAANPIGTTTLRLHAELEKIRLQLRLGNDRDNIELHSRGALRVEDFSQALLDVGPRIVHFSGHGAANGRLYLENEVGAPSFGSVEGLADLLKQFSDTVECVIVNACESRLLARTIAREIDYVIGMREAIWDAAAVKFSIGFYQGLAAGRSIESAFALGRSQVWANDNLGESYRAPVLFRKNDQEPR